MNNLVSILCWPPPVLPPFRCKIPKGWVNRAETILAPRRWRLFKTEPSRYPSEGSKDKVSGVDEITQKAHHAAHRKYLKRSMRMCEIASAIWLMERGYVVANMSFGRPVWKRVKRVAKKERKA